MYMQYPTALWRLSIQYSPEACLNAVDQFMFEMDGRDLDFGFPVGRKRQMLGLGSCREQRNLIFSEVTQGRIKIAKLHCCGSSLDRERKIARDKRAEARKMTNVARASRVSAMQEYRVFKGGSHQERDHREEDRRRE